MTNTLHRIKRYFWIYLKTLEQSATMLMINRANLFVWAAVHALELGVNIIFFQVIYLRSAPIGGIGGWNIYEILILLGYMEMTLGLGGWTFYPMMYGFSAMLRRGDLDWKLTRPLDIQFLITFPWLDLSDSFSIIIGVLLMTYGVWKLSPVNLPVLIILFLFFLVFSQVILYSILVFILSLAFKSTKLDALDHFYWSIQWLGRYPNSVFKGIAHFIFMFVIPIGLVSSVPARTLAGVFDYRYFILSMVMAIVLFITARKVFLRNIKSYTSASS